MGGTQHGTSAHVKPGWKTFNSPGKCPWLPFRKLDWQRQHVWTKDAPVQGPETKGALVEARRGRLPGEMPCSNPCSLPCSNPPFCSPLSSWSARRLRAMWGPGGRSESTAAAPHKSFCPCDYSGPVPASKPRQSGR
jgi:hypothetical protein